MILLIEPAARTLFRDELTEMHRLRYRVFKERLAWTVTTQGDLEIDDFDAGSPVYLLHRRCDNSRIEGCVRLLPSTGPTMLRDVFSALADGRAVAATSAVWESSRFAVDTSDTAHATRGGLAGTTYELFAGMIEFGLYRKLIAIVTVTDTRMERILRRANWPLRRIAEPRVVDGTLALAGYLEISLEALNRVRQRAGIGAPVLWAPALTTRHGPMVHPRCARIAPP
jgi:N-acyl-L-homoserine lactone synthetase